MKKFLFLLLVLIVLISCGGFESMYDDANYESLVNEYGTLYLYSGGYLIQQYPNVKIIYTGSDTISIYFKYNDKIYYWQGEALFEKK
jgi:hypothetical protein